MCFEEIRKLCINKILLDVKVEDRNQDKFDKGLTNYIGDS